MALARSMKKAETRGTMMKARCEGPKRWVTAGTMRHPAILGLGPGIMQNAHKVGEAVDLRELRHAIAFLARYPSRFAAT